MEWPVESRKVGLGQAAGLAFAKLEPSDSMAIADFVANRRGVSVDPRARRQRKEPLALSGRHYLFDVQLRWSTEKGLPAADSSQLNGKSLSDRFGSGALQSSSGAPP